MFNNTEPIEHPRSDYEPIRVYELVDEVPTAYQENGTWHTGRMPTAERVQKFIENLTRIYGTPFADAPYSTMDVAEASVWWDTYSTTNTPIRGWADTLTEHEAALLEYACKVLSSHPVGTTVWQIKKSGDYPETWGSGDGLFRSTLERLFDRLRLNYTILGPNEASPNNPDDMVVERRGHWVDRFDNTREAQLTLFGRRHTDNGYYALRRKLSTGKSTLGSVVGLTDAPDNFAMPLDWSEAVESGLAPGLIARLPDDIMDDLDNFANDLDAAVSNATNVSLWGGLIGNIASHLIGAPALGSLIAVFGGQSLLLSSSLSDWPDSIRHAASALSEVHDTAYNLLHMLRTTDLKGVLGNKIADALDLDNKVFMLNVSHDQAEDVEHAMRPSSLASPISFKPMILLGDTFAHYAAKFGINPRYGVNVFQQGKMTGPDVVQSQRMAANLWTSWWNDSQPTIDVAYVVDSASIILEQLLYLDDALLALNDLAVGDGLVAAAVRRALEAQGLAHFVDALGGASPCAALRFLFRQFLTDLYMDWFRAEEGVEADNLYPIFAWMNTRTKRQRIDEALGPLIEATSENAGNMSVVVSGLRALFGFDPNGPIMVRGALLPNVSAEERGAVGRAIDLFGKYSTDPERAANEIGYCDLGLLRGWLEFARESSIVGLQDRLEPHWTYATDDPGHIPDLDADLPHDGGTIDPINP